jgi:hypothetical protein
LPRRAKPLSLHRCCPSSWQPSRSVLCKFFELNVVGQGFNATCQFKRILDERWRVFVRCTFSPFDYISELTRCPA